MLLDGAEIHLERGEHVTLVGPNGAGKTTLIDTLAGVRPLAAGKLRTGHNVKLGHLSQHADELGRGPGGNARTVLESCAVHTGLTPNKARALLGRFLFSGEEAEKPLDGLSGGERRRLSLAILVASGANVLILDEPTNHLDIESREALEDALLAFEGSMLLVSHDRALLEAVGTRTVAVDDGKLRSYEGGWQEYLRVREERRLAERAPKGGRAATAKVPASATAGSDRPAPAQPAPKAQRPAKKRKQAAEPGCASDSLAAATARDLARGANGNGGGAGGCRRTRAGASASSNARSSRRRRRWPHSTPSSRCPKPGRRPRPRRSPPRGTPLPSVPSKRLSRAGRRPRRRLGGPRSSRARHASSVVHASRARGC